MENDNIKFQILFRESILNYTLSGNWYVDFDANMEELRRKVAEVAFGKKDVISAVKDVINNAEYNYLFLMAIKGFDCFLGYLMDELKQDLKDRNEKRRKEADETLAILNKDKYNKIKLSDFALIYPSKN